MLIRIGYEIVFDVPVPAPMVLMLDLRPERDGVGPPPRRDAGRARRAGRPLHRRLRQPLRPPRGPGGPADALGRPDRRGFRPARRGRPRRGPAVPSRTCRRTSWSTCWAAATARSTASRTSPGRSSGSPRRAGGGCRRSATGSTSTSTSATTTPGRPRRPTTSIEEREGSAGTSPTWPSRFCRCLNIPARYATGYLGDIGVPPAPSPDGLQRLVRGLPRRPLVHLRRPPQHPADRPDR